MHDEIAALCDVHDFFERFPEFRIEYRVDYGINKAVHVPARANNEERGLELLQRDLKVSLCLPEPCCQNECGHAWLAIIAEFGAHGVHDVACEERHPAD